MRPHEQAKTDAFVDSLQFFPVTTAIAKHAGGLKYEWVRNGVTLSTAGTTIAAVALPTS